MVADYSFLYSWTVNEMDAWKYICEMSFACLNRCTLREIGPVTKVMLRHCQSLSNPFSCLIYKNKLTITHSNCTLYICTMSLVSLKAGRG